MVSRAGGFEEVGVRAVVEGVGRYLADSERVNRSTQDLGRGVKSAEQSFASFDRQQQATQARLRATGEALQQAGQQAIIMGAGLAAPGTAALAFSINFEEAMTKVSTLSGIAAEDIAGLSEEVRRLAVETGRAPTELADALLAITSTGLQGAEALDVLERSARASAIGLGTVEGVGRTITGILKAYEKQNITAAQASDILFATVREGGAEADEVASALGRVTGIAATFGVTLQDVGAFVATFTRLGVSSDEAVTALRGTITTIFAPTKESAEALEEMGLSAEQLRATVKERGLVAALEDIIEAAQGDTEALDAVIGNVRALAGVLGTAGSQGEAYRQVLDNINNSLGVQDAAFAQTAETSAFKYNQAVATLKNTLIDLGANGLPALNGLLESATALLGLFTALPEPVQTFALGISILGGGALVAAGSFGVLLGGIVKIGPALRVIIPQVIALRTALLTTSAAALAHPAVLAAVAVAAVAAGAAYLFMRDRAKENAEAQEELVVATEAVRIAQEESIATIRERTAAELAALGANQRELDVLDDLANGTDFARARRDELTKTITAQTAAVQALAGAEEINRLATERGVAGLEELKTSQEAVVAGKLALISSLEDELATQVIYVNGIRNLTARGYELERQIAALRGEIVAEEGNIRQTNAALGIATSQTNALGNAAGGAVTNISAVGDSALDAARKLTSLTAEALAAMVMLNDLAGLMKFARDTSEADFTGFEQLSAEDKAIDILKRAEAARARLAEATKRLESGAGVVPKTSGGQSDAEREAERLQREAEREAEEAAAELARIAEEEFRLREQLAQDAADREREIFQQRIRDIDQFGDLVATALRRQAKARLDIELASFAEQRSVLKRTTDITIAEIERRRDAAVEAAEEARDAQVAAIEAATDAQVAALEAQIDAIEEAGNVETRAELERNIALAFDPNDRADAEKALRAFDRQQQIEGLRGQIEAVQQNAQTQIEIARTTAEAIIEIARERAEQEERDERELLRVRESILQDQEDAARETYERDTDEFRLQSEARRLIAAGEFETLTRLLNEHVPEWRTAGLSYGQQLIEGIRASGVEQYITDLLAKVNQASRGVIGSVGAGVTLPSGQVTPEVPAGGPVGAAAGSVEEANRLAEIAGRQEQGQRAAAGGAPEIVLDQLRQGLVEMGVIPQFRGGLDMGVVKRPILASLDAGEVVMNRAQQAEFMRGPVYERGAFEGMFAGATFGGDARENARAIRREMESFMDKQLGRDAFLHGT